MVWTLIYHGKLANQIARLAAIVVKTLLLYGTIDFTQVSYMLELFSGNHVKLNYISKFLSNFSLTFSFYPNQE